MAEKPNKTAIGSVLLGVAAIITAVVPLLLDDTDKKVEKADDKAELVMELIKQHLEFQGKQIDELKQENRETRQFMRAIFLDTAAEEEPVYMSQPDPSPVCTAESTPTSESNAPVLVPTKLIEEPPEDPAMQVQAPLPSPKDLDFLLSQKGL